VIYVIFDYFKSLLFQYVRLIVWKKGNTLKNALFCPISASDSNFIPVVKIFVFLDLEQN
jgi:hypothetical protein